MFIQNGYSKCSFPKHAYPKTGPPSTYAPAVPEYSPLKIVIPIFINDDSINKMEVYS